MKRSDISDLEVCRAVMDYDRRGDLFPYQILAAKFGCVEKVAYAAIERAERHGLIESGVSLRTGWLSNKGTALLEGVDAWRNFKNG